MKEGKEEGSSKMSATGSAPVDDQKVEVSGQGSEKEVIGVPEKAQVCNITMAEESGCCSKKTDWVCI